MGLGDWNWESLRHRLPGGKAWPEILEALLHRLLHAAADELARDHQRALELVEEVDPRTTYELLPDWERVAGLPDPCLGPDPTLSARRRSLEAKLTRRGGQSREYFVGVAADLGFPITIDEFEPWSVEDPVDELIYGESWWFVWGVNAPDTVIDYFTMESGCDEPLSSWGDEVLECVIRRLAPAHTYVFFTYGA